MYTKVTNSHIRLLGQTLTGFAIDDDDAVTAAESDDHGAGRGGGAETERERKRWQKCSRGKANDNGSTCGLFGIPLIFDFIQPCSC